MTDLNIAQGPRTADVVSPERPAAPSPTVPAEAGDPWLPSMTDQRWKRRLTPALIAAGIDLTRTCTNCPTLLINHDGPLIVGADVHGDGRRPVFGSRPCADAWNARPVTPMPAPPSRFEVQLSPNGLLPGEEWDGGWVGQGHSGGRA